MLIQNRCFGTNQSSLYEDYHDQVWGRPVYDSLELFEKLCLDGQQAGLSWITILKKQESYQAAFANFNPYEIVKFDSAYVEQLMQNTGIVRNRLKINSVIKNAHGYIAMEQTGINFAKHLWSFVDGQPLINNYASAKDIPTFSQESQAMSKDLKKRGFSFVGPTICYAFMQATGLIMDLSEDCDVHNQQNMEDLLSR